MKRFKAGTILPLFEKIIAICIVIFIFVISLAGIEIFLNIILYFTELLFSFGLLVYLGNRTYSLLFGIMVIYTFHMVVLMNLKRYRHIIIYTIIYLISVSFTIGALNYFENHNYYGMKECIIKESKLVYKKNFFQDFDTFENQFTCIDNPDKTIKGISYKMLIKGQVYNLLLVNRKDNISILDFNSNLGIDRSKDLFLDKEQRISLKEGLSDDYTIDNLPIYNLPYEIKKGVNINIYLPNGLFQSYSSQEYLRIEFNKNITSEEVVFEKCYIGPKFNTWKESLLNLNFNCYEVTINENLTGVTFEGIPTTSMEKILRETGMRSYPQKFFIKIKGLKDSNLNIDNVSILKL